MSQSAHSTPLAACLTYPVGHPLSGHCLAPLDGTAAFAVAPEGQEADPRLPPAQLCLVQRVSKATPGSAPLYRNWCQQDLGPFPLAPDALGKMLALTEDPASGRARIGPEFACPAGSILTLDLASGRLACAEALTDPCTHSLISTPDGQFLCRPQPGTGPLLPNPCPERTWMMPTDTAGTFRCENPCGEGQVPRADGTGAFVCVREE
jgi:hypothetical protein